MVTSILPAYLVLTLGVSPAIFGLLDGLHQGGASLARLVSGVATDRFRRYRELAVSGYLASALSRAVLLFSGSYAPGLAASTLIDRLGKGIRTAPRDALISLSAPPEGLGVAFGVHRTLDTIGATLGPIVALAVLWFTRQDYRSVIVASFAIGLVGAAIPLAFIRNPRRSVHDDDPSFEHPLRHSAALRRLVIVAGALGALTIADSMVYLVLQRRIGFPSSYMPALFVATPAVYALLAVPCGRLADRFGRGVLLIAGHMGLLALYAILLMPTLSLITGSLCIVLLGAYYAATDGVLPALASAALTERSRATGLSLVGTALDLGRMAASMLFGLLWTTMNVEWAVGGFAAGLTIVLAAAAPVLLRASVRTQ
ncbi:MAG: MFS transporter [Vicinamibacterales bacterium]